MEIRKGSYIAGGKGNDRTGKLNKSLTTKQPGDRVSLGGKPEKLPQKPAVENVKATGNTAKKTQLASVTSGFTATDAAASAVTGSAGAAAKGLNLQVMKNTIESLKKANVSFLKKKGFYIPFVTGKFAKIGADEVAKELSEGRDEDKKNLRVQPQGLGMMPIMDEGDVQELGAFHLTGATGLLPRNEIAGFLNDAVSSGMELKGLSGENLGAYGAYNYVTTGWESAGVEKQSVDLYRDGTAVLRLTPDKIRDPFAVKKELKDAWDAYNTLEKYGSKYLSTVGEPIGKTSFLKKFEIFEKLKKIEQGSDDAEIVYSVIEKKTESGEDFEKVASYYFDIRNEVDKYFDTMDALKAFNYARSNLKDNPVLSKAFVDIVKGTGDVSDAIKALRLITAPVAKESFNDRREAMLMLTDVANNEGVEAYELASQYMLPGETIKDSAKEYAEMRKGQSYRSGKQVPGAFEYMRTELKDSPEQREIFKGLFKTIPDKFKAIRIMNSLKAPFGDSTYKERAEIMTGLLKSEDSEKAREDFEYIKGQTKKGEKLVDVGRLYADMLDAVKKGYYQEQARKAFKYVRDTLKQDPGKTSSFSKILRKSDYTSNAIKTYETIQKPVKGEDYQMRENTALKLLEHGDFKENYEVISKHIYSGETLEKVTDQFLAIHKAMGNKEYYTDESRKAFIDMKEKSKNDLTKFDRYINLLKEFKNFDLAKKAQELLEKPVKNEGYEAREEVLLNMLKWEDGSDNSSKDAVDNYETLVKNMDKDETLPDAQKRFKLLFDVLGAREKSEEVRDAFSFVGEHVKKGTFPGKNSREVTDELVRSLLISDSLEDAKEHLLFQANQGKDNSDNTIRHEDDYVIIGGVKLKKKK
ncbi:MAG: hypothetical protein K8T10_00135 [Candidatus Eremiobacteraeota bacterium]|nr:hypothetical protein [Candidatus Eremiobacteraeota bacterium]